MTQQLLEDKVAVVTGGNGGIGKGIALALAREGCHLAICGRNREKNEFQGSSETVFAIIRKTDYYLYIGEV